MPVVRNDIELRSISRKHLSHSNEERGGGWSTGGQIETDPKIQCAETIPLGSAIFIYTDGKARLAGVDPFAGIPADAFALDSGEENDYIRYTATKIIYNPEATLTVGSDVWLVNDSPNITTANPDLEAIIQKLGVATDSHKFLPIIEEVFIIES